MSDDFCKFVADELKNNNFTTLGTIILTKFPLKATDKLSFEEFKFICDNFKSYHDFSGNQEIQTILICDTSMETKFYLFESIKSNASFQNYDLFNKISGKFA